MGGCKSVATIRKIGVRIGLTPSIPAMTRLVFSLTLCCVPVAAQAAGATEPSPCAIESMVFEGWQAQQVSNAWVKVVIVPQLGGRVMQLYYDGHPYLFVNAKFKGQYISPADAAMGPRWINYGGDKIWPMPEGSQDEHHWPGPISDLLDDGNYEFKILSKAPECRVRLDGPPEPKTGLQYSREISLRSDSPKIRFHAVMKNIANHDIRWSMQSVTQYDTGDSQSAENYNHDFWAFTPVNANSSYLMSYHVRNGLADDPSYRVGDGLFCLHWLPLENEVWLDSNSGWLAVTDAAAGYGVIERFAYVQAGDYPGKATVIFYKNGSAVQIDDQGFPRLNSKSAENTPRYMEAELNSPIVPLAPGETYAMDTEWHPVRVPKRAADAKGPDACTGFFRALAISDGLGGTDPK